MTHTDTATRSSTAKNTPTRQPVAMEMTDFTPLPRKSLTHRGVEFTRSSIIRAASAGKIKTRLFRMPGSTKGRRYILTESLDSFLESCMAEVPFSREEAA